MVRKITDDGAVRGDRSIPVLEFLRKLPEEVSDPRGIPGVGIIVPEFTEGAAARFKVGLGLPCEKSGVEETEFVKRTPSDASRSILGVVIFVPP